MPPRLTSEPHGVYTDTDDAVKPCDPAARSLIRQAREAAHSFLARLAAELSSACFRSGWNGTSRRGRLENLLASEHLLDDDEFVRRWASGEQLYLDPETPGASPAAFVALWELTLASLGRPRLLALGAVLAIADEARARGTSFRLCVNATEPLAEVSEEVLAELIDRPVSREGPPPGSWRRALGECVDVAEDAVCFWVSGRRPWVSHSDSWSLFPAPGPRLAVIAEGDSLSFLAPSGPKAAPLRELGRWRLPHAGSSETARE
jgi:hypothetical protein